MRNLLIATSNPGKFREYKQLLKGLPFNLVSLSDQKITLKFEEKHKTYVENAMHKAAEYAQVSGLLTLADDSGLEVDALSGEPGVMSARYAGENADDARRVAYLLSKLEDVPRKKRKAKFVCAIAIALSSEVYEIFRGECRGYIAFEPKGEKGFGYDPVFYLPKMDKTMAELPPVIKNKISHRAKAAQKAYKFLKKMSKRSDT